MKQTAIVKMTSNELYCAETSRPGVAGSLSTPMTATVNFKGLSKLEKAHARSTAIVDFQHLIQIATIMNRDHCTYKEAVRTIHFQFDNN